LGTFQQKEGKRDTQGQQEGGQDTRGKDRKGNVCSSPGNNEEKVVSLMLGEHPINLAEAITEKNIWELQRTEPEQKLNREGILENCERSLVISWLGKWVARVLRMNSSKPVVGWKDEHPQSVRWLPPVIDK
jgi:hypothetical protein